MMVCDHFYFLALLFNEKVFVIFHLIICMVCGCWLSVSKESFSNTTTFSKINSVLRNLDLKMFFSEMNITQQLK